jgi:hypothetical protein
MAATTRIIYQPYLKGMKPGTAVVCRDEAEGARRADKAMEGGSIVGAHVVRVTVDEEAGDYGEPDYLVTVGSVPPRE